MKTATTKRLYKVLSNGNESIPLHLGAANRIAKALRSGKGGFAPVAATVVPA